MNRISNYTGFEYSINMEHTEKLSNWLKEGCWMTCEVVRNQLKIAKLPNKKDEANAHCAMAQNPQESNNPNVDSFNVPVEQHNPHTSEKLVEDTTNFNKTSVLNNEFRGSTESENDSHSLDEWLSITLKDNYTQFQARDNGKAIALFIVHILSSTLDNRYYRFKGVTYKKVIIFGIIIEKIESKKKIITIDDGTGQLKCYVEDNLNERHKYYVENDDKTSSESMCGEMNEILTSRLKEISSSLPTFDNLQIGDRVCISGNISFHSGYFNLFVEKLERHKKVKAHIHFMKRVFYLYKNSYY